MFIAAASSPTNWAALYFRRQRQEENLGHGRIHHARRAKFSSASCPPGRGPNSGSDYTGLSSFGLDENNELYMCQMSSVGGQIYKLARSGPPPASRPFPPLLSQTGAFTDLATLDARPESCSLHRQFPLWSDGAVKTRWMALPTNTFVHFAPTGEWTFPNGTVFVKHFDLPIDDTNPTSSETARNAPAGSRHERHWFMAPPTNGGTDYTDADLVTNALTEDIVINTGSGTRTQPWFYPGPLDCLRCHTSGGELRFGG